MTPIRVALTAGVPRAFDVAGDYFHVLTAPVTDLVVRFDDGEPVPVYEGVGFRRYFNRVEFQSETGQSVVAYAGFGSVHDGRASANVNVTATVAAGNTFGNGGDVSCLADDRTQLIAADTTRLYVLLGNSSDNTITVRVGDAAVAADDGIPLEPGVTMPIATTAALYAWNPDPADDVTINVSSVRQV